MTRHISAVIKGKPPIECFRSLLLAAVAVIAGAGVAGAHRAFVAEFDAKKPVHLAGTVTQLAWENPHVWIYMSVTNSDGTLVRWAVHGDAPYGLSKRGLTSECLAPGAKIVLDGYQAKNGTPTACGRTVTLADGRTLFMGWCTPPGSVKDMSARHIRYKNDRIAEVVELAIQRSSTFGDLVATIETSDAVVYIKEGRCGEGDVRACLRFVSGPGPRYLLMQIDPRQPLLSVVRQVAHELQHASEIVVRRDVVDQPSIRRLYEQIGFRTCKEDGDQCWETRAAQATDAQVGREVLENRGVIAAAYFGLWTLNVEESHIVSGSGRMKRSESTAIAAMD